MPDTDAPANPLLVSTRNAHKVGEIRAILGPGFLVSDLTSAPAVPEIEETGDTFEENATLKAVAASLTTLRAITMSFSEVMRNSPWCGLFIRDGPPKGRC